MQAYSKFGLKARAVMLQKEITMTALAKEIGVSTCYISDILKGSRKAKRQKEKIAEFLGIDYKGA